MPSVIRWDGHQWTYQNTCPVLRRNFVERIKKAGIWMLTAEWRTVVGCFGSVSVRWWIQLTTFQSSVNVGNVNYSLRLLLVLHLQLQHEVTKCHRSPICSTAFVWVHIHGYGHILFGLCWSWRLTVWLFLMFSIFDCSSGQLWGGQCFKC